ncbi:MAG: hypothetical protein K2G31_02820, partial [Clostridia bacterium]|nr:hypothetical protein [Clostridia bacterium]
GDRVALSGRIQSREYQKNGLDGSFITTTAYEVSICKLVTLDYNADFNIDKEFNLNSASPSYQDNE